MAGRRFRGNRLRALSARIRPILRLAGRVTAAAVALSLIALICVQFARAIAQNISTAHQLSLIRSDISVLERRRADQQRELKRLADPQGAIPEIHDRLRLVRPNETLIFVSPVPSAAP